MPATGFTPIQLFHSSTSGTLPTTSQLFTGEVFWNIADNKVYGLNAAGSALQTIVGSLGNQDANTVAITGGSINKTAIGNLTASTGSFTSLSSTLDATIHGITVGLGAGNVASNTAIGFDALFSNTTSGVNNTANGYGALYTNTSGSQNTAAGYLSLALGTTASNNTAIGYESLYSVSTGSNNFAIGYLSGNDSLFTVTTQSNIGIIGNTNTATIYSKVALTVVSDIRDKTNITFVPLGLDFVNKLEPISYQFKTSRDDNTPNGRVRYGFSAQNIAELEETPVIVDISDPEKLRFNEQDLVAVLVNAIKELSNEINKLKGYK